MIHQHDVSNGLLSSLPPADFHLIQSDLLWVDLILGKTVQHPHEAITSAIFPVSGLCSVLAVSNGIQIEAGIVGKEGFVGTPIVLEAVQAPYRIIVQGSGRAVTITAANLQGAMERSGKLRSNLLRFAHVFEVQMSQTALANGSFTIERRLARWLLMCQDRVGHPEFLITHEFLSIMLAVRRSGVTVALQS